MFRGLGRRFVRARDGVAAIEFALILPVMIGMFLGMTEITVAVNTDRKLALVTRAVADLTGRASTLSSDDILNIFAAGRLVMQPYPSSTIGAVISSITVTTSGTTTTGKVTWSCSNGVGLTALPVGSNYAVPDSFKGSSTFVAVQTQLLYTPMFTGGTWIFNENVPWPVRSGNPITLSSASC